MTMSPLQGYLAICAFGVCCISQKSTCPVFGCQIVCARGGSVVRDDRLRSLLAAVPEGVEFVWLRGDRLSITPPAGVVRAWWAVQ